LDDYPALLAENNFIRRTLWVPTQPGLDTPAQYLPPAAAKYLAGKLGCRLPTREEWQALDEIGFAGKLAAEKAFNFRTRFGEGKGVSQRARRQEPADRSRYLPAQPRISETEKDRPPWRKSTMVSLVRSSQGLVPPGSCTICSEMSRGISLMNQAEGRFYVAGGSALSILLKLSQLKLIR